MAEWERREKEEREKDRARVMEKKSRDTGNANLAKVGYSEGPEIASKPGNTRRTEDPKFKFAQKLRKWPAKQQKETSRPQPDPEAEQIPHEDQAHVKDKGNTFGLVCSRQRRSGGTEREPLPRLHVGKLTQSASIHEALTG